MLYNKGKAMYKAGIGKIATAVAAGTEDDARASESLAVLIEEMRAAIAEKANERITEQMERLKEFLAKHYEVSHASSLL